MPAPPIAPIAASASRTTRPANAAKPGPASSLSTALSIIENLLDRQIEQAGDLEGERQRRVIFSRLDRIDRLARDIEPDRQVGLAPVMLGSQYLEAVLHLVPRPTRW